MGCQGGHVPTGPLPSCPCHPVLFVTQVCLHADLLSFLSRNIKGAERGRHPITLTGSRLMFLAQKPKSAPQDRVGKANSGGASSEVGAVVSQITGQLSPGESCVERDKERGA
jgi:hypothetical protein